ncbi:RlpA-like double-psi beta-barrel-protein domain-containing protein-containing protein [Fennellomyces sp. T-0311]|nr:RlpA-like double-psi beta-barrel-protein domain-containing protein-containing protein [Fennellomyces sp. T-0311]
MRVLLPFLLVAFAIAANAAVIDYIRAPSRFWTPSEKYNVTTVSPSLDTTEVAVNCSSTISQATLTANETFIHLQGTSADSNEACFAATVTSRPGSLIRANTKRTTRIRDADNLLHRGKVCDLTIPDWSQIIYKNRQVDLVIPLANATIHCDASNDSKPAPTKTTTTPPKPTTTTTTRTTTTYRPTTTTTRYHPTTTTHRTTTTTSRKPTPTSDPDDGGDWVNGKVTFFTPNQGACGDWNDDSDMIVALGPAWYGNMNAVSKYCGSRVQVTGPRGNSITVTVKDACPPCDSGHLDLSPAAFEKLGDFDTGILKVKWRFL